jgi:hypothetical protein
MELLIFSKNRPIQLKWCILSTIKFIKEYDCITVIWSSSELFKNLYLELIASLQGENRKIKFIKERNFKLDVAHVVCSKITRKIMFLTDDSIFINYPILKDFKYTLGTREVCEKKIQNSKLESDEDYLFSVDGRVYSSLLVKMLVCIVPYRSPSSLESRINWLFKGLERVGFRFKIVGQKSRCLVNLELNRVSDEAMDNTSLGLDLLDIGVTLNSELKLIGNPSKFHQRPEFEFDICSNIFVVRLN